MNMVDLGQGEGSVQWLTAYAREKKRQQTQLGPNKRWLLNDQFKLIETSLFVGFYSG